MPLYEYSCRSCGEKEEKLEGFDAPTEHDCPRCGTASGMRREVSLTSFTLAGGGWYKAGYANGSREKKSPDAAAPVKNEAAPVKSGAAPASGGCAGGCACRSAKNQ